MRKFIGILAALIVGSFFVVGLVGTSQAFPGEASFPKACKSSWTIT